MTALELMTQSETEDYRRRVKYFMAKAAIAIISEDADTAHHSGREAMARGIIGNPETKIQAFALAVITNATIAAKATLADATDGDIEFVVNSVWNSLI